MAAITHAKSLTMGDTSDTSVVRPSDWNSGHQFAATISGITAGAQSTASGTNLVYGFADGVIGSFSTGAGAATLWIDGGGYTALSYNNRQLGASSHTAPGQNSVWLAPFRAPSPISASSLQIMMTYTGTLTSSVSAQFGQTMEFGIYSQNTADPNRFDTWWTGGRSVTIWNSGTSSGSYNYGGTTSSSAGSNVIAAFIFGMRAHQIPIGSILPAGLYVFGSRMSTSSAGYGSLLRTYNAVIDNPMPIGMGTFGQSTNSSIGYVDGGVWSATSGALPASLSIGDIRQTANAMPWFKIGAI